MTRALRLQFMGGARCGRGALARPHGRLARRRHPVAGRPRSAKRATLGIGAPASHCACAANVAANDSSPQPSPAPRQRGHVTVRSAMWEKGMPAIPRPQENEGVGEHVRTRFHVGPKAACEIAEPLRRRTAPNEENLFLLPDRTLASEPAKENDPTVGLMSRRHPLSPTRTC